MDGVNQNDNFVAINYNLNSTVQARNELGWFENGATKFNAARFARSF